MAASPSNETALPLWPAYETDHILSMSSDQVVDIADDYRKEQIDFLNNNQDIINGY